MHFFSSIHQLAETKAIGLFRQKLSVLNHAHCPQLFMYWIVACHVPYHLYTSGFIEDLFHSLSRNGTEAVQSAVPWILFFAFVEDRREIYKQSLGTSSDCHDLSKLIESGLAIDIDQLHQHPQVCPV